VCVCDTESDVSVRVRDARARDNLCVAVCCSVLHCVVYVCCSVIYLRGESSVVRCGAVCCSVLQCVAVCCSVLQCVAVCCSVLQCVV